MISPRPFPPAYEKYAILLTEDKDAPLFPRPASPYELLLEPNSGEQNELLITKFGKLLQVYIA